MMSKQRARRAPDSTRFRVACATAGHALGCGLIACGVLLGLLGAPGESRAQDDDAPRLKVLPFERGSNTLLRSGATSDDAAASARLESLLERARERELATARVRDQLGPHGMSKKGLARRDARMRRLMRSGGVTTPETLNVLLIRIAFEDDRSGDLTSVTTDGNFQLGTVPEDSFVIDPPPHDKAYFESHMRGLASYWGSMSNGLIDVQYRVLPDGDDDAVFLSDIADYGPGSGGFWTVELLEVLVRDMIEQSDQQLTGQVNLADYDFDDPNTYIIFAHAGADLQSNLVFQEGQEGYSPNDIPTFFVSLGDSARVELQGVDPDTGNQGLITECSVIPETTNQDGLLGSISAALMHEFGHALGLPDLYSTRTGLPTIGYWGIMDSGTNLGAAIGIDDTGNGEADRVEVVTGLLPPAASAWTRWYLGFTEEIRVGSRPVTVDLPASYRQDTREKVMRLDVSPDEFFLVENRWIPPIAEGLWFLYRDPDTGVVQYLGDFTNIPADDDVTVPPNTHLYDFFMPFAGGLQVWRVRQDRAEAFDANNTVQAYRDRLGIELIEADGVQDVGVFDFNTRGFIGSDSDSFRDLSSFVYTFVDGEGNESQETFTYEATSTQLLPNGRPNSQSTFRIPTGVALTGIGSSDRVATGVTAQVEGLIDPGTGDGWPADLPDALDGDGVPTIVRGASTSPVVADLGGVQSLVVVAQVTNETAPPRLYAYGVDGSARYAQPAAATLSATPIGPLLWTDESPARIASVGVDGSVQLFADQGGTVLAEDFAAALSDSVDSGPVWLHGPARNWIVAADAESGRIDYHDPTPGSSSSGTLIALGALRSNLAVTRVAGGERLAAVVENGLWIGAPELVAPADAPAPGDFGRTFDDAGHLVAWPSDDGAADERLVFVADDGEVLAFVPDTVEGGPRVEDFGRPIDGPIVGEPALGDVDGDGSLDLVMMSEFMIWARHASGADLLGFPKRLEDHWIPTDPFTDEVVGGPLVADVDEDGLNEIVFTSSYGLVHAMDSEGGNVADFPRRVAGGNVQAPLLTDVLVGADARRALVLFDALGDTLGSGRRTFSARLTAVDVGATPESDPAERPAEWLARGGSPLRGSRAVEPSGFALAGAGDYDTLVYPNPVNRGSGDAVRVGFFSAAPHQARVRLYNLEGQEVLDVSERVEGDGVPDVLEFSTQGLQSGAYLCRVQYLGASGRTDEVLTLYIER